MSVNVQSAILSLSEEHGGSLSVVCDSKPFTMRSENPLFGQAVEAYRREDWDSLMGYLNPELGWLLPRRQIGAARFGCDREPRRYREAEIGHLSEVGSLSTQQIFGILRALAEVVDKVRSGSHYVPPFYVRGIAPLVM